MAECESEKMNGAEFNKEMEKITFPGHVFADMEPEVIDVLKRNWSGNPEKFIDNLERWLNVKVDVRVEPPK